MNTLNTSKENMLVNKHPNKDGKKGGGEIHVGCLNVFNSLFFFFGFSSWKAVGHLQLNG